VSFLGEFRFHCAVDVAVDAVVSVSLSLDRFADASTAASLPSASATGTARLTRRQFVNAVSVEA
jgi:hypothetical protein